MLKNLEAPPRKTLLRSVLRQASSGPDSHAGVTTWGAPTNSHTQTPTRPGPLHPSFCVGLTHSFHLGDMFLHLRCLRYKPLSLSLSFGMNLGRPIYSHHYSPVRGQRARMKVPAAACSWPHTEDWARLPKACSYLKSAVLRE